MMGLRPAGTVPYADLTFRLMLAVLVTEEG